MRESQSDKGAQIRSMSDDEIGGQGSRPAEQQVKKTKYCFQPQWLTQYEGNAMLCVYCRQCGPSVYC